MEYDQFAESIKHLDLPESKRAELLLAKKEEFNQQFEREYADYQKRRWTISLLKKRSCDGNK